MIKLSVVIITFNEEKNIERCLTSVRDIADEIIVLDSFSKDNTEQICKKFKVKFIQQTFDNFASQKNKAVEFSSNDFVLSLDADEVLSEELERSIKGINENDADAYIFNRLNIYCGKAIKYTSWYPDRKLRLWNKNKAEWKGDIHEIVKPYETIKIKKLKGDLLHYSFNSLEEHLAQINKFSSLKAYSAYKKGEKTNLLKILFKPTVKFFKDYILKFGILGGYYCFIISKNSAFSEFQKQIKIKELYKNAE